MKRFFLMFLGFLPLMAFGQPPLTMYYDDVSIEIKTRLGNPIELNPYKDIGFAWGVTPYEHGALPDVVKVGDLWYVLDREANTAEVTYSYDEDGYGYEFEELEIPSSITHNGTTYRVPSIGDYAFSGCHSLTSITIPNSVTSIAECAFYYCDSLTSLTIPGSVTSIGEAAFCYSGLTSIIIPNSVTSIGDYAFSYCYGLTSVTIGNSVTSISSGAFCYCLNLTSVDIPNSVTSIGSNAFEKCI